MSEEKKKIILSAGGTGGHMTPAAALGQDLVSRGFDVVLVTDQRGQKYKSLFEGIEMHVIRSGTLGAGVLGKVKGIFNLGLGILQAFQFVKKYEPDMVVGFGGYPSVPAVYAAQKLNIPTIIHEQNAIIGRANAFLAPKADRIALSFPNMRGIEDVDRMRVIVCGNPVRPEISALYHKPYPVLQENGALNILVLGGSLGAHVFSDIVPKALSQLNPDHIARLRVVQQCREDDLPPVQKMYDEAGIRAELATFFDDAPQKIEEAHLLISRSGASTVCEIATAGRPAIFVPYPHHKDQQQKMNAEEMADARGAWIMTESGFTVEALLAKVETFLQNPESLFRAAEAARTCGKPDAARKLGNLVTAIASGWNN